MIRTRFAPSPTGFLHIGGLRTAAYSFALAKHNQGEFYLRIEDTDQKREVKGATEKIYETLKTFGLQWDKEPVIQSQRMLENVYRKAAEKLLSMGSAFYCQCDGRNAKIDGYSLEKRDPCRERGLTTGAIKLKVPDNQLIGYTDFVLNKRIEWNSNDVADTTLLKSDGYPTYHLAVVVDDNFMQITHALRGHDWMPSTPVHLMIYDFLGLSKVEIGHLTDIQSPNGGKLSKRRDSVACEQFLNDGYLPEALLNFVILLGWAPKDNREMFSLPEFVEAFDPAGFQKANPLFTYEKLNWFNGQYIRQKTDEELAKMLNTEPRIISLIKDRLVKLSDFKALTVFLEKMPEVEEGLLKDMNKQHLEFAINNLDKLDGELVKSAGFKVGDFFMSLRIAICGSKFTPPINDIIKILGNNEAKTRIEAVLNKIK